MLPDACEVWAEGKGHHTATKVSHAARSRGLTGVVAIVQALRGPGDQAAALPETMIAGRPPPVNAMR